jgi:hypothetical protein
MNINILGYNIDLEIIILGIVLYFIIVFNLFYSTIQMQGVKDLLGFLKDGIEVSVEEGFEVLKQTAQDLKQKRLEKFKNQSKKVENVLK